MATPSLLPAGGPLSIGSSGATTPALGPTPNAPTTAAGLNPAGVNILANNIKAATAAPVASPKGPATTSAVSTPAAATADLNAKTASVANISNGVAQQSQAKQIAATPPPTAASATTPTPPTPSADDISASIAKMFGDSQQPSPLTQDPNAPGPLDQAGAQLQQIQAQTDQAFQSFTTAMTQLQNGTFPLSAAQQAQIDSANAIAQTTMQAQTAANQAYSASVKWNASKLGMNVSSPVQMAGELKAAADQGIMQINSTEAAAAKTLSDLQTAIHDENYKDINDLYSTLTGYLKDKDTEITSLATAAQDHADKIASFNLQVKEDQEKQANDALTQTLASESNTWKEKEDAFNNAIASGKLTESQVKDAQTALNDAQTQAVNEAKNNIDAATNGLTENADGTYSFDLGGGVTGSGAGLMSPTQLAAMPGITSVSSGGMFFTRADLPTGKLGDALALQYQSLGIPELDASQVTAANSVDIALSNLGAIKTAALAQAPKSLPGAIGEGLTDWASVLLQTPRGELINTFNGLKTSLTQVVTAMDQTKRVNPTILAAIQANTPTLTDLPATINAKMAALNEALTNAKTSILGNKVIYTDPTQYASVSQANADYVSKIRAANPTWSPDDVMQYINAQSGGGGDSGGQSFNSESQTSSNGTAPLAVPPSERDPSKVIAGYDFTNYATDPKWGNGVGQILNSTSTIQTPQQVTNYISQVAPDSPLANLGNAIVSAASAVDAPVGLLLAIMQQESNFGTLGRAADTYNPGNVGNVDSGANHNWGSWLQGIEALAENISKRLIG